MIWTGLLLLIPLSLVLAHGFHAAPLWVFGCATFAIIPLAEWIRRATEHLARSAGSAIGGLLNVTFGNLAELILALFVLSRGETDVVKGQITGSIIGNSLLGLGLAIVVGCWGRERQTFKRERAGLLSSLLILSTIALLVPALFDFTERNLRGASNAGSLDENLSLGVAVVLIVVYLANLIYTLFTHRDVFSFKEGGGENHDSPTWPIWKSLLVLGGCTALIALEAELASNSLQSTATQLGISSFFLGVVVLAIVGNAAEYVASIYFARQDRLGMVFSLTVGGSIQVALLVAPILVIVSRFTSHRMNLVFANPLELIAIAGAAFAVNSIAQDGEVTWFEGVLLMAVYALFALAFFFVTP